LNIFEEFLGIEETLEIEFGGKRRMKMKHGNEDAEIELRFVLFSSDCSFVLSFFSDYINQLSIIKLK